VEDNARMKAWTENDEPLGGASLDIAAEKRRAVLGLFPEARTEGGELDFDVLRRALGETIDPGRERYGLTWAGKAACFRTVQALSTGTLLPAPTKSVNFDTSKNVIIEGDNLEVLKLIQKAYLGKVKMIYIDPPYNTGNDFIYPDDYSESLQTYLEYTGQVDNEGRRFGTNTDTDGRFHSRWLNMMYPRLYLARNLLTKDGVLFISINDVELASLIAICNELFGEENHLATFVWINEGNIDNQSKIKTKHEYVVAFARDEDAFQAPAVIDPNIPQESKLYREYIENSIVKNGPANPISEVVLPVGFPANFETGTIRPRDNFWPQLSAAVDVSGSVTTGEVRARSGWSSKDLLEAFIRNGCKPIVDAKGQETAFYVTTSGSIISRKARSAQQSHVLTELRGMGTVRAAAASLAELGITFAYPKPVRLIQYLVEVGSKDGDLILDFFAGSGTLAEAVLDLNRRQGNGSRRFMLVQLPERVDSEDFATIAAIAEERVTRVIERMRSGRDEALPIEKPVLDLGFRVFSLAESNVRAWDSNVAHDEAAFDAQLSLSVEHLRHDRSDIDILFEVILKEGFPLSTMVTSELVGNKTLYGVADGAFLICLDRHLDLDVVRAIAARQPDRVLLLDQGFAGNDQLKTNAVQTFKGKNIVLKTL